MARTTSKTILDYQIARPGYHDSEALREFFFGLDRETNAQRFLSLLPETRISEHADRLIRLDTVVYGAYVGSELVGVAELHVNFSNSLRSAELAIAIKRRWQSKGIGRALFQQIVVAARNRRVKHVYMICLRSNKRMLRIALKETSSLTTETDLAEGIIDVPMADLESWVNEYACDLNRWNSNLSRYWTQLIA